MDPYYELNRVQNADAFYRKLLGKRLLSKFVGELYIGRRVKLVYFRRWLDRIALPSTPTILEVGSGDGAFAFFTAHHFETAAVIGLELNPAEAEGCRRIARRENLLNLNFVASSIADVAWIDHFDLVYCLDVLEHIADDTGALRAICRALKVGGYLLVHVPNRSYMETDGRIITVPDAEAWKVNPGHVRQGYAPGELAAKLTEAGFEVLEINQTQGPPISYAYKLHNRLQRVLLLRILILPIIDLLTWIDRRQTPRHGNTVWAWARKLPGHD
jgi:2-polyprenyl-3-methyl-5-hydroxy-6-metoxy-1,4-benzoquinol methylase